MQYSATFSVEPSYLHATLTGPHSSDNILRFLSEARAEGARRTSAALLLDFATDGVDLDLSAIFHIVTQRSEHPSIFKKIAFVDCSNRKWERMKFAESVAVNRGLNVRLFRSLEEGRNWLEGG